MSICLIMIMRDIFFDIMGYTKGDKKKTKSTLIYIIIKLILIIILLIH